LLACGAKEAPPIETPKVGIIIGEVFSAGSAGATSVGDAKVEVYGTASSAVTEAGKQFALQAVPLGSHTVVITHEASQSSVRVPVTIAQAFQTVTLTREQTTLKQAWLDGTVAAGASPAGTLVYLVGGGAAQLATVGDDGVFELTALPVGAADIAFSKPGFDTVVRHATLAAGANSLAAVSLSATSAATLSLTGSVKLTDSNDQRGTVVTLNAGLAITTTDYAGAFTFTGLAPGVYSIEASRPGYRRALLAQVGLDASGKTWGLEQMYIVPGSDTATPSTPVTPVVTGPAISSLVISSHQDNDEVLCTVPLIFAAQLDTRSDVTVAPSDIVWSYRRHGTTDALTELGRGRSIVVSLPAIAAAQVIDLRVVATAGAESKTAEITVVEQALTPLPVVAKDQNNVTFAGVAPPAVTVVTDASGLIQRLDVAVCEGQPALLVLDTTAAAASAVTWSTDTGYLFTGLSADLSTLPTGVHLMTLSVAGVEGQVGTLAVKVTVSPFAFTLTIVAPLVAPAIPYYFGQPLPLQAQVQHSFQSAFSPTSIRWSHPTVGQVGIGLSTKTYAVPAGPGVIRVDATDVLGNVASAFADYTLQQVTMTASWVTPNDFSSVLQGTPVTFRMGYTHSLVPSVLPASSLSVHYFSSIQGLLTSDAAIRDFGVNDAPVFSALVPGQHVLTVRLSDGSQIAEATRTLTIRSPAVSAVLTSPPADKVYFSGVDTVALTGSVNYDSGLAGKILFSWLLDGVELDPTWATYQPAATTYGTNGYDTNRASLNLGTYVDATPPFDSPRWDPGAHLLQFFVRLDDTTQVAPALGCVSIPNKAVCLSVQINVAPGAGTNVCPTDTTSALQITADASWSGVKRLNCPVVINNGATLSILPGSRVVVDGPAGNLTARWIQVASGTLKIGDQSSSANVVIDKATGATGMWQGIDLNPASASTPTALIMDHVILRSADTAIDGDWSNLNALANIVMRDVVLENGNRGMWGFCPDVYQGLVFRNFTNDAIEEAPLANCPSDRVWDGLVIEGGAASSVGLHLTRSGTVTVKNTRISGVRDAGLIFDTLSAPTPLTVLDSVIEHTRGGTGVGINVDDSYCVPLHVERTALRDNIQGIRAGNCSATPLVVDPARYVVLGSLFDSNTIGFYLGVGGEAGAAIHLSTFVNNGTNVEVANDGSDVQAQGNYLGALTDTTTTGGASSSAAPGTVSNLPLVKDYFDNGAARVVRVDNVLPTAAAVASLPPLVYLAEPQRTERYNPSRCLPLMAAAPLGGVDLASCVYTLDAGAGAGTTLQRDADGCATTAVADGYHDVAVACNQVDGVGTVVGTVSHATRIFVDHSTFSGRQVRPTETWSGPVTLTSDVVVPAGHTLTIAPGTVVTFEGLDRRRMGEHPFYGGTSQANVGFGSRSLVEIYVEGALSAVGTVAAPITFEPATGIAAATLWGGLRVRQNGSLSLSHVVLYGSGTAVHGEYVPGDPNGAPLLDLTSSSFHDVGSFVRGVCPATMTGITGDNLAGNVLDQAHCGAALAISGCTFTGMTSADTNYLHIEPFASGGPPTIPVSIGDSTFDRGVGASAGSFIYTGSAAVTPIQLLRSTVRNFYYPFNVTAGSGVEATVISDSVVTNFYRLFWANSLYDSLTVQRSYFADGTTVLDGAGSEGITTVFTGNRVLRVTTAVRAQFGNGLSSLTATGNQFESVGTVFQLSLSGPSGSHYGPVALSGNNYVSASAKVLDLDENGLSGCPQVGYCTVSGTYQISLDMSGSYFPGGVTDPTALTGATILDAPPPAVTGRIVDSSSPQATPLALTRCVPSTTAGGCVP
jgi:hypothetical protein